MRKIKFEELLEKEKDMQNIIRMHQTGQIYLTNKQLDEVLKRRGERKHVNN